MGSQCFVKVQGENQTVFPVERGARSVFFCEFYSRKPEEHISVFFQVDGKDVYDNPRKRLIKCTTDEVKKKLFGSAGEVVYKCTSYEWLWGVNASACRLISEEPRLTPPETSTAVICFTMDPEELVAPPVMTAADCDSPTIGRGRGAGSSAPPDGGRGLRRERTVTGTTGRGRGRGERTSSIGSSSESDALQAVQRRRTSSGVSDDNVIKQGGLPAENSVMEACLDKFAEVSKLDGHHLIICIGGPVAGQVESLSEIMAKRMLERARERKHDVVRQQDIIPETYANNEFHMFVNMRLMLSKSGVGRCILVARDVDCERLLMLWTAVMVGLKISISTRPVQTPDAQMGEKKREALSKAKVVMEEIKKTLG